MAKNKNTATVTWVNYYNCGTYLQAFALQKTIFKLGYNNEIIDDILIEKGRISLFHNVFLYIKRQVKKNLLFIFSCRYRSYFQKYKIVKKRFDNFKDNYLKVNKNESLWFLGQKYDQYVCGSDQIWSPNIFFDSYYYLGFTEKKKIAYAPSFGTGYCSDDFLEKIKPLVNKFDFISVRENIGIDLMRKITEKEVIHVADPTLLLTKHEWESFFIDTLQKVTNDRYIFCYFLSYNIWYIQKVKNFAKEKGLSVKIFMTSIRTYDYQEKIVVGGPCEFLNEIRNAAYIFTDSFHGSIFSILFEKEFYTFKRFSSKDSGNQNLRIENLFSLLNLNDRFTGESECLSDKNIDYAQVNEFVTDYRARSLQYLSDALNN